MNYNKFIGMGHLTKDVELRYTPSGIPVAKFTIAINTRYKSNNENKDEALFLDATCFGKQADACNQYLSKGMPVHVEGRIKERFWEYEGKKYNKIELVISSVRFLRKKETDTQDDLENAVYEDAEIVGEPF